MGAVFDINMDFSKPIESIESEAPSPLDLPQGCPFQGRCEHCMDICKKENPKLVEVGSDAFMNCLNLRSLRMCAGVEEPTGLKQLLAQIKWQVEVSFEQEDGEREAVLMYPEYYESYDEIGPAHIFELNLTGEGFRARQCFKEGVILLNAYDEIFPQACVEESAEVLIPMAWNRLYAACGLSPEARADYEEYVFVLAIGYFIAMPYLFDHVILAPCHNDFIFYDLLRYIGQKFDLTDDFFTQDFHVKLVNINLAAPFFIHLSTAFMLSVVTAIPYLFFEIWRFISPALYPNERKGVRKALTIGTFMFFIGVLLGYFMVYPLTLRFLSTYQLSSEVENILSLNSYIDNFMMLILCMGLAFELPLVTWLLSLLGIVNKSFLRKYRRHAVVVIVIAAAIITPTGDPFTLSVVAIPLYLLYEMSILMIKDKKEEDITEEV